MLNHPRTPYFLRMLVILILGVGCILPVYAQEAANPPADATPVFLYGNHQCPVSGDPVQPSVFVDYRDEEEKVYGRIYLCCSGCAKKAESNLEKLYTSLHRMDRKTGKPKTVVDLKNSGCAMSGEPIIPGLELEFNGLLVHFCCEGCGQDFLEDPNPRLASLVPNPKDYHYTPPAPPDGMHAMDPAGGPLKKELPKREGLTHLFANPVCPIMGDPVLPENFIEYRDEEKKVYGRIHICCDGCDRQVEKDLENLYRKYYRTDSETGKEKEPVDLKNTKCPISGDPVAEGAVLEYNGMRVHFCCDGCGKSFLETPDEKLVGFVPDAEKYALKSPADAGTHH